MHDLRALPDALPEDLPTLGRPKTPFLSLDIGRYPLLEDVAEDFASSVLQFKEIRKKTDEDDVIEE